MINQCNDWGPQGCRDHIDEIADHLMKQADERGWWKLLRKMTWQMIFGTKERQ
jgi:hypothetical protein